MQDPAAAAAPARWSRSSWFLLTPDHTLTKQQTSFHTSFVFVSLRSVSTGPGPRLLAQVTSPIPSANYFSASGPKNPTGLPNDAVPRMRRRRIWSRNTGAGMGPGCLDSP